MNRRRGKETQIFASFTSAAAELLPQFFLKSSVVFHETSGGLGRDFGNKELHLMSSAYHADQRKYSSIAPILPPPFDANYYLTQPHAFPFRFAHFIWSK